MYLVGPDVAVVGCEGHAAVLRRATGLHQCFVGRVVGERRASPSGCGVEKVAAGEDPFDRSSEGKAVILEVYTVQSSWGVLG